MAYCYVATIQRATSVTTSCVCSFTSSEDRNLVVARGSYLEVYNITPDGLAHIKSIPIYGRITGISAFRPNNQNKDQLFVLTAKLNFCSFSWDSTPQSNGTKTFVVKSTGRLYDRAGKHVENGHILFADPGNRMIGLMVLEGQIKIIPIDNSGFKEAFDLRLDLLRPIDIKFLHGCGRPTLCFLFEDDKNQRHMKSYIVESKEKELTPTSWQYLNVDPGASFIIPVPLPAGGVIIVGATTITYVNHWTSSSISSSSTSSASSSAQASATSNSSKNIQLAAIPRTNISSWGAIDTDGSRYLLGDMLGNLYILVLCIENAKVTTIAVNHLGLTSIPETLNYLDNGVVYVGSSFGDSQLIRLSKDANVEGSYVEILESFTNIGPVVDMCVVTGEKQGQSQIITCSGAYNCGSLRIIRSGIGINTQAFIELEGLKECWAIKASDSDVYHKYLVQGYTSESRILAIENEEIGEVEDTGRFNGHRQSLFCGNMQGGLMVQVTSVSVSLLRLGSFELVYEYISPEAIILAHGTSNEIVLALPGGKIVALGLSLSTTSLHVIGQTHFSNDIACVSIQDSHTGSDDMNIDDGAPILPALVAIGLWTENTVRVVSLPSLQECAQVTLLSETQVRDAMIVKLGNITYLLLGLGDGTLLTYTFSFAATGLPTISGRRKVVIGRRPVSLSGFYNAGVYCVFAACDRPTVIYNSYDKLLFSVVNVSEVNEMTPFHSESFPESLCLISESGLAIGNIDTIQKVHIHTKETKGQPRRLAYHSSSGLFGVIVERTGKMEMGEETRNFVVFYDENMEIVQEISLEVLEQGLSITTATLTIDQLISPNQATQESGFEKSSSISAEYFVVGTAYGISSEFEPSNGRLLVFTVTSQGDHRRVTLLCERDAKAGIYALAQCAGGKIAACIGSRVLIYSLQAPLVDDADTMTQIATAEPIIQQIAFHAGHIFTLDVKSQGEYLVVCDMLRSMTLLRFNPSTNELSEVARDFNANMMRTATNLGNDQIDNFLGIDDSMNFFTCIRNSQGPTVVEQARLEVNGEFHLGDHVNVIRQGTLGGHDITAESQLNLTTSLPNSTPSYIFGTVTGALGSLILLGEEAYRYFYALEKAIKAVIGSMGGLSHSDWRGFSNERRNAPCKYFIDGDLVETFLDLSRDNQVVVVRQLNDELNAMAAHSQLQSQAGGAGNTSVPSMVAILNTADIDLSVEDVLRRVEDVARMH